MVSDYSLNQFVMWSPSRQHLLELLSTSFVWVESKEFVMIGFTQIPLYTGRQRWFHMFLSFPFFETLRNLFGINLHVRFLIISSFLLIRDVLITEPKSDK